MTTFGLPPSPEELRRRARRRRAVLLVGAALAVLAAIILSVVVLSLSRVELDSDTLCPTDRRPPAQVAVLLDVTDPYSEIQREFVRSRLLRLQEELPKHAQLALYALGDAAETSLQPRESMCNPGSGRDASWLWKNPEMLQRRWERGFREPLLALLEEAFGTPRARQSPIMEQIQAASVGVFDPDVPQKQLVIVSDLLQNSAALNMYRNLPDFDDFRRTRAYEQTRCSLAGARVRILYVLRPNSPYLQRKRSHVRFWEGYFDACDARIEHVELVPGLEVRDGSD